jgi:hypothetical protein
MYSIVLAEVIGVTIEMAAGPWVQLLMVYGYPQDKVCYFEHGSGVFKNLRRTVSTF